MATETADTYREATESEKTTYESTESTWEKPSDELIAQWKAAMGGHGTYNEATGYFEAYDFLKDITAAQVRQIFAVEQQRVMYTATDKYRYANMRCNIPQAYFNNQWGFEGGNTFLQCKAEVLFCWGYKPGSAAFSNCTNLRKIIGMRIIGNSGSGTFANCKALEWVTFAFDMYGGTVYLDVCSKLDPECIKTITRSNTTSTATIRLHPDVFAKLTDEQIEYATSMNVTLVSAE
jgi:hypothetical protein